MNLNILTIHLKYTFHVEKSMLTKYSILYRTPNVASPARRILKTAACIQKGMGIQNIHRNLSFRAIVVSCLQRNRISFHKKSLDFMSNKYVS